MSDGERYEQLRVEQEAFDQQLDDMLQSHPGEFVLFKDGKPVSFYSDYQAAYKAGIENFGTNQIFLVSEVKKREPAPISLSWFAGVMFGR